MAKVKITELNPTSSLSTADVLPVVSIANNTTYKITVKNLSDSLTQVSSSISASHALNANSAINATNATNATNASYATTAGSATTATTADTASFVTGSGVKGPFGSNSILSASYAVTASYALNGGGGGGTPGGSTQQIQYNNGGAFGGVSTATFDGTTFRATGSFSGSFRGDLVGTSSWSQNSSTASYVITAQTASFVTLAQTASFVTTAQTASFVTASNVYGPYGSNSVLSASYASNAVAAFPYTGNALISGSLTVTGSTKIAGTLEFSQDANFANKGIKFPNPLFPESDIYLMQYYKADSWTPAFAASGATFSYNFQQGYYVRLGRVTYLWFTIILNTSGNSGFGANALTITGFPGGDVSNSAIGDLQWKYAATSAIRYPFLVDSLGTIYLYKVTASTLSSFASAMQSADLSTTSGTEIYGCTAIFT